MSSRFRRFRLSLYRYYYHLKYLPFARERRVELAYDEYPPLVVEAFISAEDKTFFSHGGLVYPGLVGAVFDYTTKSVTGGRARGG